MEAGRLMEDILEEVIAFAELAEKFENDLESTENEEMALLGGTVPPDLHPSNGSPPDRERELNEIKLDILKIEEQIRLQSSKEADVRTVPPDLGLKKSTRKQGTVPGRRKWKELKLCGKNEIVRNQKKAMSRMFLSGKLKRGTVPQGPATVPQLSLDCMQEETSRKACEGEQSHQVQLVEHQHHLQ